MIVYEMKAPNGEILIARNEEQKKVMEKFGFVEVKKKSKEKSDDAGGGA